MVREFDESDRRKRRRPGEGLDEAAIRSEVEAVRRMEADREGELKHDLFEDERKQAIREREARGDAAPEVASPETLRNAEGMEIDTNPEGYRRRHRGEQLDPETQERIRSSLERHRKDSGG